GTPRHTRQQRNSLTATACTVHSRQRSWRRKLRRRTSTQPLTLLSAWALTHVRQTSWFAAPVLCHTAPVRTFASQSSLKAKRLPRQQKLAQTSSAPKNSSRPSTVATWTSTLLLQPQTRWPRLAA